MFRGAAKVDDNQKALVRALRDCGCTVLSIAAVGNGAPDIVVGWHKINYLFEIKDGSKVPSARKLTEMEAKFHASWRGSVNVVESLDDALKVLGIR